MYKKPIVNMELKNTFLINTLNCGKKLIFQKRL